jgi:alpha-N-arabinofuranosidase
MNPFIAVAVLFSTALALEGGAATARELHVALTGSDSNDGSPAYPFRTVQHAATQASSGDTVTVHAGTYRERVHPPTGGVTFQASPGDTVILSGSEPVSGWTRFANDTWRLSLPSASTFGNFNPYVSFHADHPCAPKTSP